jgi:glycerol-3-phosphate acyltransferase PlsY
VSPWLLIALAYLLGSIPASYIAGRMVKGIDLRDHGSGNLGATNTFRVLGARVAAPVMLFDVLKGTLPVALFPHLEHTGDWRWQLAYGAAAIIGHVFSIYMRFRGGKGVATSAGVFLGLSPVALGVAFAVWLLVLKMTKMVSASSISGALALIAVLLIVPERTEIRILGLAVAAFVIFAHRSNVGRILRGTEPRFGAKKEPEATVAAAAVTADGEKVE